MKAASHTPGLALCLTIVAATTFMHPRMADAERPPAHQTRALVLDHRYSHDKFYPPRGHVVHDLPRDAHISHWRGSPYYFHGGIWYRPARPNWIVVAPPVGLTVAALPPFYTTIWIGGVPYYYANDVYYAWRPTLRSYVVVERPSNDSTAATQSTTSQIYVYPKDGQSAERQATDRYECHQWAVSETGFDPTQPFGGVVPEQSVEKRASYTRAITACLEGRGYSVK